MPGPGARGRGDDAPERGADRLRLRGPMALRGHRILNQIEAQTLTEKPGSTPRPKFCAGRGVGKVVLTLGPGGALVQEEQGLAQRVPAPAMTAVDTTGAGDVVVGVVAAGIDRGLPLMPAVRWAVAAASQKVTRPGTSSGFPSSVELAALARARDLP